VADRLHNPAALSQRFADLVVLLIAGGCVLEASAKLLPAPDPFLQVVLVIASTALAARRLVALRSGKCRVIGIASPIRAVAVLAGMMPWFALTLVHGPSSSASLFGSVALPASFRAAAASLILSSILAPFWIALRGRRRAAE